MRKMRIGLMALFATAILLTGCNKQATEEECLEYLLTLDGKAFEKGNCKKYLEW